MKYGIWVVAVLASCIYICRTSTVWSWNTFQVSNCQSSEVSVYRKEDDAD